MRKKTERTTKAPKKPMIKPKITKYISHIIIPTKAKNDETIRDNFKIK